MWRCQLIGVFLNTLVGPSQVTIAAQLWLGNRGLHFSAVTSLPDPCPAGEVCCPGGKRDEGDADDIATALREAEVGREEAAGAGQ